MSLNPLSSENPGDDSIEAYQGAQYSSPESDVQPGAWNTLKYSFSDAALNSSFTSQLGRWLNHFSFEGGPAISEDDWKANYARPGLNYVPGMSAALAQHQAQLWDSNQDLQNRLSLADPQNSHDWAHFLGETAGMVADPVAIAAASPAEKLVAASGVTTLATKLPYANAARTVTEGAALGSIYGAAGAGLQDLNLYSDDQSLNKADILQSIGQGALWGTLLPTVFHGLGQGARLFEGLSGKDQAEVLKTATTQYATDQPLKSGPLEAAILRKNIDDANADNVGEQPYKAFYTPTPDGMSVNVESPEGTVIEPTAEEMETIAEKPVEQLTTEEAGQHLQHMLSDIADSATEEEQNAKLEQYQQRLNDIPFSTHLAAPESDASVSQKQASVNTPNDDVMPTSEDFNHDTQPESMATQEAPDLSPDAFEKEDREAVERYQEKEQGWSQFTENLKNAKEAFMQCLLS